MVYTPYHIHTDYSLLDSCSQYTEYIDKAKEYGMNAIAFSEHGKISGWFKKMQYCKQSGLKYIHAVECYLTESTAYRVRDNYHTILIAKNKEGFKELNNIITKSFDKEHFYYVNRITFDEFLNLSNNIITTSACLAGPLNKLDKANPYYEKLINRYDYLEIQPHDDPEQKEYNIDLACISEQYKKPLIAGTDAHSLNQYKADCRKILMKRKKQSYGNEDNFDMTFKSYDELVAAFTKQNAIPSTIFMSAIENTNIMADLIEDYDIDTSIKYPLLYGSRGADHQKFVEKIESKFKEKIDNGIIPANQVDAFRQRINEELEVFTKTGMDGFMLSESEILEWCHNEGIVTGPARGSVAGSGGAYIADIIDLNPETWHTVFSRFANADRIEVGDIDTDVIEEDRPKIFNHIKQRFGTSYCARVSAFGTMAERAAIDNIGGALRDYWDEEHPGESNNPFSLENIKIIKSTWGTESSDIRSKYEDDPDKAKEEIEKLLVIYKQRYPEIFEYFEGMVGVKVSQSIHPAGMIISPITLPDNFGTFDKDGDDCLFLDMEECHDVGLVKYDFLCLVNVKIIRDTCKAAGIPYPNSATINWEDENVWNDMLKSSAGIFQMESDFAFQLLSRFKPKNLFEMSLVTASIRPSGASYRDRLMAREFHHTGSELIDNLLKDNYGNLVYQEDVIKFLQEICGFSGSEADSARRAIAKKQSDKIQELLPKIIEGYCAKSDKPHDVAAKEAEQFVQVIIDASRYMFGYNHSIAYCMIGYICAYLRYYYPVEFITALLNNAKDQDDITKFTDLAHTYGIAIVPPKYGFSSGRYKADTESKCISKGIASIKFIANDVADNLLAISQNHQFTHFVELIDEIFNHNSGIKKNQFEILMKIDFFDKFGNYKELSQIYRMFDTLGAGTKLKIKKDSINNEVVANIIGKYCNFGLDSKGRPTAYYQFNCRDKIIECMCEIEDYIKSLKLNDIPIKVKLANYMDCLGYIPATGKTDDRMTLMILDATPITGKNGKIWQYRISAQSLGSGKTARLSVSKELFTNYPLQRGTIVNAKNINKDEKGYWHLANYTIL